MQQSKSVVGSVWPSLGKGHFTTIHVASSRVVQLEGCQSLYFLSGSGLSRTGGSFLRMTNSHFQCQLRAVSTSKLKPKFQGCKLKLSGSYKRRFKRLKSDHSIKMFPKGFGHRRFRKGKGQKQRLGSPSKMHHTYANTLKRMGFR